jgi:hypothetical protein
MFDFIEFIGGELWANFILIIICIALFYSSLFFYALSSIKPSKSLNNIIMVSCFVLPIVVYLLFRHDYIPSPNINICSGWNDEWDLQCYP